jgi:hypothetical protein
MLHGLQGMLVRDMSLKRLLVAYYSFYIIEEPAKSQSNNVHEIDDNIEADTDFTPGQLNIPSGQSTAHGIRDNAVQASNALAVAATAANGNGQQCWTDYSTRLAPVVALRV